MFFLFLFLVIPAKLVLGSIGERESSFFFFLLAIGYWSFNGHWVFGPWSFFFVIRNSKFAFLPIPYLPI